MNRPGDLKVLAFVAMMCLFSTVWWSAEDRGQVKGKVDAIYRCTVYGSGAWFDRVYASCKRGEEPAAVSFEHARAGAEQRHALRGGGMDEWRFHLSAGTAVSGPWGVSKDHDWYLVEGVPPDQIQLYRVGGRDDFLSKRKVGLKSGCFSARDAGLFGSLGYSFQYISQNALGYSGWQYVLVSSGDADNPPAFELYYSDYEGKALEIHSAVSPGGRRRGAALAA
ncbi:MAG: hypothetical protein U5P10_08335 [Spirochaetia bacterium]|nr:hypothetical protein [Spirochaetia bacterium]